MSENNDQQKDPWGNKPKQPANIDEWIDQGIKKLSDILGGKKTSSSGSGGFGGGNINKEYIKKNMPNRRIFGIVLLVLLAATFYMSIFQIQPGESGVVLRFGKHNRNASPGLNFVIPFAEEVIKVNIEKVRSIEFVSQNNDSAANYDNVSSMVTADRNVININWVVQYRIRNPENYLFYVGNVSNAIRDFSEYVVRRLVGNRDFDYILNTREELSFAALNEIQELLEKYKSGIELVALQLLDVTPPERVRPAFNEVNEADQDKTRLVNEAQREVNQRIPKARGDAQKTILEAEGYAIKRINEAEGNASRFTAIYLQYQRYPAVTRRQLYINTLRETLPQIKEIIVIDKEGNVIPLLNLGDNTKNLIK